MTAQRRDRDTTTSANRLTETERKMERNQMRTVPFKMLLLQENKFYLINSLVAKSKIYIKHTICPPGH